MLDAGAKVANLSAWQRPFRGNEVSPPDDMLYPHPVLFDGAHTWIANGVLPCNFAATLQSYVLPCNMLPCNLLRL